MTFEKARGALSRRPAPRRGLGRGVGRDDAQTHAPADPRAEREHQLTTAITENIDSGLFVTDREGRPTFMNPAAERILGYTFDELQGMSLHAAVHHTRPDGAAYPKSKCPLYAATSTLSALKDHEDVFIRKDGTFFPGLVSVVPLRQGGGEIGAVIELRDITVRKREEQERERLLEDLRKANAAKDDFLGMVSHELKTPITTIYGNAEVLKARGNSLDPAARQSAIEDIASESERLHRLIDNLLVLARLERGQAIAAEPILIRRVAERLVTDHRQHYPRRQIVIREPNEIMPVVAEPLYVEQVLRNLLSNAEKYSAPSEPIEVVIGCDNELAELSVSVLDRGIGFAEEEGEELFTPFHRGPRTEKQASGVGIGLAVCRRLIEAQGGRIWARPRAGGGADIGFALPVIADPGE